LLVESLLFAAERRKQLSPLRRRQTTVRRADERLDRTLVVIEGPQRLRPLPLSVVVGMGSGAIGEQSEFVIARGR
jgi:hypothetical protein